MQPLCVLSLNARKVIQSWLCIFMKEALKTIACALAQATQQGKINCSQPLHSAIMYFGILRNIEWKVTMGVPMKIDDQEILDHIEYCVDVFLNGHRIR